jgi:hypothetical protein
MYPQCHMACSPPPGGSRCQALLQHWGVLLWARRESNDATGYMCQTAERAATQVNVQIFMPQSSLPCAGLCVDRWTACVHMQAHEQASDKDSQTMPLCVWCTAPAPASPPFPPAWHPEATRPLPSLIPYLWTIATPLKEPFASLVPP